MVDLFNESFDKLINGSVIPAAVSTYTEAFTFGGVIWLWPIFFIGTLFLVAIKTENPTMVAIYAILGTVALGTMLPTISNTILAFITIFSVTIWFYSLFVSPKVE
ncbi:hypothetical protein LCGC14_2564130 [marine sediment metagenome]|uniref:Uncharacterized protein n=1 Tax=marine sediment metagenome TaxID=412755 RepID=A0A0F9AJ18_9ZZZZ